MLPLCTSSTWAFVVSRIVATSSTPRLVGPPLTWPATSGWTSATKSGPITPLPGIDAPPVCTITFMPRAWAQRVIWAATAGSFTPEMPISPTRRQPAAARSSKSASVSPFSNSTAPACTFTPEGRMLANALWTRIASAFVPAASVGRPGTCGSPADSIVVTPPCMHESIQSVVFWRGVQSPITGCTWLSWYPGISVAPPRSITPAPAGISTSPERPTAAIRPSITTTVSASATGAPRSPVTSVPMLRRTVAPFGADDVAASISADRPLRRCRRR